MVRPPGIHRAAGVRVGLVTASAGSPAGTTVPIWLVSDGNPVDQPLTPADAEMVENGAVADHEVAAVGSVAGRRRVVSA
jgi:hypothetical protein